MHRSPSSQAHQKPNLPWVLPYLDLVILGLILWAAKDWLVPHVEPLASFIVQSAGDPFGWLHAVPIAVTDPGPALELTPERTLPDIIA